MSKRVYASIVVRILPLFALGLLLLLGLSCTGGSCASDKTIKMIKEETGIDLSSPTDAIKVGAGGQTQGNKDQEGTLDTVASALKSAKHEQQGDKLTHAQGVGNQAEARNEYFEAIKWTKTNTDGSKNKKARLLDKVQTTYADQALWWRVASEKINNPEEKADLMKAATAANKRAQEYAQAAADTAVDIYKKAEYLDTLAFRKLDVGDNAGFCDTLRTRKKVNPNYFANEEAFQKFCGGK